MSGNIQESLEWPGALDAITLFTEDFEVTKTFYQSIFGLPILFEGEDGGVFLFGATMLNFLKTSEAPELIEPSIVASADAGARFLFTLKVANADAKCAELVEKGVRLLNGPIDRPWGRRTAAFQDPSGYIWEIAQEL